jgi:hypothetical protein
LRLDSTDTEKAQLKLIETDFMDTVKKQCSDKIAKYEDTYKDYLSRAEAAKNAGWIAFLMGGSVVTAEQRDELSPQLVRFRSGDPLTFFIFSKQDIETYFSYRLKSA